MHIDNGYPLYSSEARSRMSYYPGTAGPGSYWTPWLWYDGRKGSFDYNTWQTKITTRMAQPAPVTVNMWGSYVPSERTGTINAQFRNDSTAAITGRVQFVLTEDSIYYAAPTGDLWHNHVARDYLPTQSGEVVTIQSGDSMTLTRSFTLQPSWVAWRCQIVTWIQNDVMQPDSTKEVWQGGMINVNELEGIEEGINEIIPNTVVKTIPNPCVEGTKFVFNLFSGTEYSIKIFDVSGRQIRILKGVSKGNTESLNWNLEDENSTSIGPGIYFYRFESATTITSGKIVVR